MAKPEIFLCRLLLYPDMMYGYYPERLPVTREAAEKRRGVRIEMGGMMRYSSLLASGACVPSLYTYW